MTEIADEIAQLKRAIRTGSLSVTYKDRSQTYRSLSEMRGILADLEVQTGTRKSGRRRTTPTYKSGL